MSGSSHPNRILIIRPSALGDVCRTVPVLVSLRRAYPKSRIEWVVQAEFTDAVTAHPDLNEVIPFPRGRGARWWTRPALARELWGWLMNLRRRRYDLVLDCQGLGRSGLMSLFTGARRRIGLASARELGWLGYTHRHRPASDLHTVDEMLSLLEPLRVEPVRDLSLYVPEADQRWWQQERSNRGLSGRYAVCAPTSRWPSKRWPIDRWRSLVDQIMARGLDKVVLIGSPGEVDQVAAVVGDGTDTRLVNCTGQTTVGQSMAVLAAADLVVANDSAPLHMAIGLRRPCVALFGPTEPARVGPYRQPHCVVQATAAANRRGVNFKDPKLGDQLMAGIEVEDVVAVIDRVLGAAAGDSRPSTVKEPIS